MKNPFLRSGTYVGLPVGSQVNPEKKAPKRIPKWVFDILLGLVSVAGLFFLSDMYFTATNQFYRAILELIMIALIVLYALFIISDDDRPNIV